MLAKWDKETANQPQLRTVLERIVRYRQHVLAIFENLICPRRLEAKTSIASAHAQFRIILTP